MSSAEIIPTPSPEADTMEWIKYFWEHKDLGPGQDDFLTMTSMLRLHRLITEAIESELKAFQLNFTDYLLLISLEVGSRSGTRLISHLAKILLVHPTTATLAVDRLQARKLLRRSPHPTDRRATEVSLTEKGRTLVRKATKALGAIDFGFAGTSNTARRQLFTNLEQLRAAIGDVGSPTARSRASTS